MQEQIDLFSAARGMQEHIDTLPTARGILLGALIGSLFWFVIGIVWLMLV